MDSKQNDSKNFIGYFYDNILTLFIGIPTLCGMFAIVKKWMSNTHWSTFEIILVIFNAIIIIFFVILLIVNKTSYKAYIYPISKTRTNYIINKKITRYCRNEKNELNFSRELDIKSCCNSLESVFDKYIWTGNSNGLIPNPKKNIRKIQLENKIGIWNYLRIVLEDPLRKGHPKLIKYNWPLIKDCNSSSPFVSCDTDIPTKSLIFELELGNEFKDADLILEEFRAIESDFSLSTKKVKFDKYGAYEWKVKNPKRFRLYRMRWSWNKQGIPQMPKKKECEV